MLFLLFVTLILLRVLTEKYLVKSNINNICAIFNLSNTNNIKNISVISNTNNKCEG